MKTLRNVMLFVAGLFVCQTLQASEAPLKPERQAVEISIGGVGAEFDEGAYRKLRKTIGNAFAHGVIDKVIVYGYGIEGGFSSCVEAGSGGISGKTITSFVAQLKAIQPKPGTFYSIQRIAHCLVLPGAAPKSVTVQVAKPDGSTGCALGSGASLTEMQKELGKIKVFSAWKLSDGLVRAEVCGFSTGQYNVYEIAETELDETKYLGFISWSEIENSQEFKTKSKLLLNSVSKATSTRYICISMTIGGITGCYKYDIVLKKVVGTCSPSQCS